MRQALPLALLAGVAFAASDAIAQAPSPAPTVAATVFPLYDIARHVADTAAEVVLVLPPGASPHTFEPTPDKMREISRASVLFVIGHRLDDWATAMARGAGLTRVVRVDPGIALRRSLAGGARPRDGQVDPHYWLSVTNGKLIARAVAAEFARLRPDRAPDLQRALAAYLARLDEADAEIRRLLADLPVRGIATFHDAFGYFAHAYGLEVVAVFEPSPGREPSPRYVQEFERKVRAAGVRVLFYEPQLSVDTLRPIASDLGVTLAMLDPVGGVPGRHGYIELMLFNARQVAAAARGQAP